MKKILSIIAVAVLVLSLSTVAFANRLIDGDYRITIYQTTLVDFSSSGSNPMFAALKIKTRVTADKPYFDSVIKVKNDQLVINSVNIPIWGNPEFTPDNFTFPTLFLGHLSNGDVLVGLRQFTKGDVWGAQE